MKIKGTGKRLIPKRDIDYLEELKANHSDPSASWGGTEVVANPTLAGTEGDLTGLQVGDTKYKVPDEVVANPTPGVDDTALTGLQVGDTKYKIKYYKHIVTILSNNEYDSAKIELLCVNNTPFTTTTFMSYMQDINTFVPCYGIYGKFIAILGKYSSSTIQVQFWDTETSSVVYRYANSVISDIVFEVK